MLAFFVVALGVEDESRAAPASEANDYEVPHGCPARAEFESEVVARTRVPGALEGVRVVIRREGRGYRGDLLIERGARHVEAVSCLELVRVLALAVATAAEDAEAELIGDQPDGGKSHDDPASTVHESVSPSRTSGPSRAVTHHDRPSSGVVLGVSLAAATGVGPDVSPAMGGFVGFDWGPSIRIGVVHARGLEVDFGGETARFERSTGRIEGCPLSFRAASLRFSPCAGADVGVLQGRGVSVENAESSSLLWASTFLSGRLGWDLGRHAYVEGELGGVVPLIRHAYFLRGQDVAYRMPLLAVEVSIAVGVRFSK